MPRKAKLAAAKPGPAARKGEVPEIGSRSPSEPTVVVPTTSSYRRQETTAIVLRISANLAREFETNFEAEEIPIWDDFTRRGRFLEARLVRANGGSEQRSGIQDYILHIVAADHEAHEEHDRDPRFRAFLAKAERLQPDPPLVWFGDTVFERQG